MERKVSIKHGKKVKDILIKTERSNISLTITKTRDCNMIEIADCATLFVLMKESYTRYMKEVITSSRRKVDERRRR